MPKKPTKIETLLRNSDKSLPLLDVQDLTVEFTTRRGIVRAVQHINISVAKGFGQRFPSYAGYAITPHRSCWA